MKIAFVLSQLNKTGPFLVASDIIDEMIRLGHEVHAFYIYGRQILPLAVQANKISFWKPFRFSDYDIIHSHGFRADLYVHKFRKKIFKSKATTISTVHQYNSIQIPFDYSFVWKAQIVELLWKKSLKSKDLIVGLTKHMARYYDGYLGRRDCAYVYNGRNVEIGSTSAELLSKLSFIKSRGYHLIGGAGHLVPRKGFDIFVRFLEENKDCYVVILGEGPLRRNLEESAIAAGVQDRLILPGFYSNPVDVFKFLDVFVLCSHAEGFSLVVLEAAAVSTPVISTNLPFLREIYTEDELPFFEMGDWDGMSIQIRNVLGNRNFYSEKVHAKYCLFFTKLAMGEAYDAVYKKCLLNRKTMN